MDYLFGGMQGVWDEMGQSSPGPGFLLKKENSSGTGSYPPGKRGLHRRILLTARNPPLSTPKRLIA